MPYGFPKELGGDSPANDARMERCIEHVMQRGSSDKMSAIRICKDALERHAREQPRR